MSLCLYLMTTVSMVIIVLLSLWIQNIFEQKVVTCCAVLSMVSAVLLFNRMIADGKEISTGGRKILKEQQEEEVYSALFEREAEEEDTKFAFEEAGAQATIAALDRKREQAITDLNGATGEQERHVKTRLEKIATDRMSVVKRLEQVQRRRRIILIFRNNQKKREIHLMETERMNREDWKLAFEEATIEAKIMSLDQRQGLLLKQSATSKKKKEEKKTTLTKIKEERETLVGQLNKVRQKRLAISIFKEKQRKEEMEKEIKELTAPVLATTANGLTPDQSQNRIGTVLPINESAAKQAATPTSSK